MRIKQLFESATAGGMSTASMATVTKGSKTILKRQKPTDNALDNGNLFQETNAVGGKEQQLSVQQLATISDEALDKAYGYGRSSPGNTFGWQANLKSAAYAKQMIDKGVTDIEAISDAIHKGWNVTAKAFVQNPNQFDDTAKLQAAGKLEAKLQQREKLMNIAYAQLPEDEKEKDRVVARAMLQAVTGGQQGVAEGKKRMSRAAKGNEKYGKDGMKALAKAGREGASEEKLDKIRDKHDNYNEDSDPCWDTHKMLGTKKKGGKSVPNCVPKEGVEEGNNPEYDDEAGMADNNLETLKRAVEGLDDMISTGDNLPEWCQEKIAVAKSMLVSVWDYMQSEENSMLESSVKENKKGVRAAKHTVKPRNPVAKNAMATVGGGGAGAHKDKKKAQKQGEVKHKNQEPAYESKLWTALGRKIGN
jgi:hypothetical protein